MISAHARFETSSAHKYLLQLCKHFSHRIETSVDGTTGVCRFDCGTARLRAEPTHLEIAIESPEADDLEQTIGVVESHLIRFAFRENLGPLEWQR